MSEFNLEYNKYCDLTNNYAYLISSEKNSFKVPINILSISNMVAVMLDNIDFDNGDLEDNEREIPLFNVNDKCLIKIIQFMEHYHVEKMKDIEKPLRSSDLKDIIQEWYADFINIDDDFLFSLINAANYMDIQPLLNLGCAKVASLIKNKTPEEIRNIFNLDEKKDKESENNNLKNNEVKTND